jgi:hypothetical protein
MHFSLHGDINNKARGEQIKGSSNPVGLPKSNQAPACCSSFAARLMRQHKNPALQ